MPALVFAAYGVFFALFFSPVLLSGNYLTAGDGGILALPAYLGAHALWEPNIMLGYPWSSAANAGWYPLWLLRLIPRTFNLYMLLAYVLAAFGTFGLVTASTVNRFAGVLAGAVYALSGFMIAHLGHFDVVQPAAWTPYVLWAFVEMRVRAGAAPLVFGALAIAMCALAGQPQVLAYTLMTAAAYVVVMAVPSRAHAGFLGRAALAAGLGIGVSAIQLLPAAELGRASVRAVLPFADFAAFSLPPAQIPMRLLYPYFLGTTSSGLYPFSAIADGSFAELSNTVGITALILAVIAVLGGRRREIGFWTGVVVVGLAASTGDWAGLAHLTYHLPIVNLFRAQGRHALEVTLALSVLAGFGVDALQKGWISRSRLTWAIGGIAALMLVTLGCAARIAELPPALAPAGPANPFRNPALGVPFVMFVLAAAAVAGFARWPKALGWRLALACVTLVDLSGFAWFAYWHDSAVTPASIAAPPYAAPLRTELNRTHERLLTLTPATTFPPNISLLWGLPAADGYVSLLLARPGQLMRMLPEGDVLPDIYARSNDPAIDLAAIRFVAFAPGFAGAAAFEAAPQRWRRTPAAGPVVVYENLAPHPRAWIVHTVRAVTDREAQAAVSGDGTDLRVLAVVEGAAPVLRTAASANDAVRIETSGGDDLTLSVTCAARCFVVTSDAYYEGWRAAVDGAPTAVYRTDYALRGAVVPSGHHVLRFRYFPLTLAAGATVSVVSLLLLAAVALRARRRYSRGAAEDARCTAERSEWGSAPSTLR